MLLLLLPVRTQTLRVYCLFSDYVTLYNIIYIFRYILIRVNNKSCHITIFYQNKYMLIEAEAVLSSIMIQFFFPPRFVKSSRSINTYCCRISTKSFGYISNNRSSALGETSSAVIKIYTFYYSPRKA